MWKWGVEYVKPISIPNFYIHQTHMVVLYHNPTLNNTHIDTSQQAAMVFRVVLVNLFPGVYIARADWPVQYMYIATKMNRAARDVKNEFTDVHSEVLATVPHTQYDCPLPNAHYGEHANLIDIVDNDWPHSSEEEEEELNDDPASTSTCG